MTETEAEFSKEMEKKQSVIDELHSQLRDASGELGEQRRKVEALQAEANERDARNLKTSNLQRAFEDERSRLQELEGQFGHLNSDVGLQLGDADKGLALTEPAANFLSRIDINPQQPLDLDRGDRQALASTLPPTHILRARLNAYKVNNRTLEEDVRGLQSKSSELAGKYRMVISLCTGVEESKVDTHLENLLRAVESEQNDVELTRVREFLQRVEGV